MAQRTKLELRDLLNDELVLDCPWWKEVGIELHFKGSELEEIERDCHYQTADCKRELFKRWLRSSKQRTLNELHQAIQTVNDRHEREHQRTKTATEEEKAVEAVRSPKSWETRLLAHS